MIDWLNSMPGPVYKDIRESAPIGGVLETEMDVGPKKRRPRTTSVIVPIALSFAPVTEAGVGEFRAFFRNDLSFGALSFRMAHPITDLVEDWRFELGDAYSVSPIGDDAYEIKVNLELLS